MCVLHSLNHKHSRGNTIQIVKTLEFNDKLNVIN